MKTRAALLLLLVAFPVAAQQERELLRGIDPNQALRLEEYNSVFLRGETYVASRYRLVQADVNVLLRGENITVTPFEDVTPIRIIHEELQRDQNDLIFWKGHFDYPEDDQLFKETGIGIPVEIFMFSWDLDKRGNALISSQNRFEFSPQWTFDKFGNLDTKKDVIAGTPPPKTPAEIERHRRLLDLTKHAFYSVDATFSVPGGSQYVLRPLRHTPRYSVIYEIAPGSNIVVRSDVPGEPDDRSADEVARANRYRDFIQGLPKEEGKQIRGDIR
jgi:hypothetical protein